MEDLSHISTEMSFPDREVQSCKSSGDSGPSWSSEESGEGEVSSDEGSVFPGPEGSAGAVLFEAAAILLALVFSFARLMGD